MSQTKYIICAAWFVLGCGPVKPAVIQPVSIRAEECGDLRTLIGRLDRLGTVGWLRPWSVDELDKIFGSTARPVRDENQELLAYNWTRGDDPIRCTETVIPNADATIKRLFIRRTEPTLEAARITGSSLVGVLVKGENRYSDIESWPADAPEQWQRIERVPSDPQLPEVGSLELSLRRAGPSWEVSVSFALVS